MLGNIMKVSPTRPFSDRENWIIEVPSAPPLCAEQPGPGQYTVEGALQQRGLAIRNVKGAMSDRRAWMRWTARVVFGVVVVVPIAYLLGLMAWFVVSMI